jgi:hypothetical protein
VNFEFHHGVSSSRTSTGVLRAALLSSAVLVTVLALFGRPFQPVPVDTLINLTPVQSNHQLLTPENTFNATASFYALPTAGDGLSFKSKVTANLN